MKNTRVEKSSEPRSQFAGWLPPQPFRGALLRRGIVAWIGIRGIVILAGLWLGLGFVEGIVAGAAITAMATVVIWLDLRVAREDILLANIGIPPLAIATTAAAYPVALELTLQSVLTLLFGTR